MTFKDHANVIGWATDKGILEKSNPVAQCIKFIEESKELEEEITNLHQKPYPETLHDMKLEFGDVLVTLILLSELLGVSMDECLSLAYQKISKRTGKMVNGIFVKDSEQ
jgi:NTP pyrophosphatase (non-canonical NTP hydrolase)